MAAALPQGPTPNEKEKNCSHEMMTRCQYADCAVKYVPLNSYPRHLAHVHNVPIYYEPGHGFTLLPEDAKKYGRQSVYLVGLLCYEAQHFGVAFTFTADSLWASVVGLTCCNLGFEKDHYFKLSVKSEVEGEREGRGKIREWIKLKESIEVGECVLVQKDKPIKDIFNVEIQIMTKDVFDEKLEWLPNTGGNQEFRPLVNTSITDVINFGYNWNGWDNARMPLDQNEKKELEATVFENAYEKFLTQFEKDFGFKNNSFGRNSPTN